MNKQIQNVVTEMIDGINYQQIIFPQKILRNAYNYTILLVEIYI